MVLVVQREETLSLLHSHVYLVIDSYPFNFLEHR